MKKKKRVKSSQQSIKLLNALLEASQLLNSSLDLKKILSILLDLATKNLHAERGTIYLIDKEKKELWSQVLKGDKAMEIRLPLGKGIAGSVGKTGKTVNLKDAYKDKRFDKGFDLRSGFRTKTMLCTPMKNKNGKIVGVFQLLNKKNGYFDKRDEKFLAALSIPASLAIENARLHTAEIEQKRVERELEVAGDIQQQLLPKFLPSLTGIELSACAIPCQTVGGDYYDAIKISEDKIALIIADVAGKGVPAALLVSTLQASLHAYIEIGFPSIELVTKLNKVIHENSTAEKFITFFICIFDRNTKSLRYVNAGHNFPLLLHSDASINELDKGGFVLGILPDSKYEEGEVHLNPGDTLILYTDGLTEAVNDRMELFGEERLRSALTHSLNKNTRAMQDHILNEIKLFGNGQSQADDITMIIMKVTS